MNTLNNIIKYILLPLLFSSLICAQDIKEPDHFKLRLHISSGINYSSKANMEVAGTYQKVSVPALTGIDLVYNNHYGIEITGGYFPILFFTSTDKYKKVSVTIDAKLVAFPVSLLLKYYLNGFSLAAGASFCVLKSGIHISNVGQAVTHNSFGFAAGLAYEFEVIKNFKLSPRIIYYHIPVEDATILSFQIRILYNILDF